jgi:hypothetical protein
VADGSKVMRALRPIIDTVFRPARHDGRRDDHETYAFDALVALAERRKPETKGVDVLHVTHLGRGPSAAQRVALSWSSPGCTVAGCPRTRVEIDHREPFSETGQTRLDECDPLCAFHHRLKHRDGWALVAGSGERAFVPPDDPRHPKNHPKRE